MLNYLLFVCFWVLVFSDTCYRQQSMLNSCTLYYEGCDQFQHYLSCQDSNNNYLSQRNCLQDCCGIRTRRYDRSFTEQRFQNCKVQQSVQQNTNSQSSSVPLYIILPVCFGTCFILIIVACCIRKNLRRSSGQRSVEEQMYKSSQQASQQNIREIDQKFNDIAKISQNLTDSSCCICLDTAQLNAIPKCGHTFHLHCLSQWCHKKSSCPLCCSQEALTSVIVYSNICKRCQQTIVTEAKKSEIINLKKFSSSHKKIVINIIEKFQKNKKKQASSRIRSTILKDPKQFNLTQLCFKCANSAPR